MTTYQIFVLAVSLVCAVLSVAAVYASSAVLFLPYALRHCRTPQTLTPRAWIAVPVGLLLFAASLATLTLCWQGVSSALDAMFSASVSHALFIACLIGAVCLGVLVKYRFIRGYLAGMRPSARSSVGATTPETEQS